MAVIKNSQSNRLLKEAVVLDLGDLDRQAQRIIHAANAEAAEIIAEARAEAQRLTANASDAGHAQGFEKGISEGREAGVREGREQALADYRQRLEHLSAAWAAALKQWERDRADLLHDSHEDVIRFIVDVARKVVYRAVCADSSIVKEQLAAALDLVGRATAAEIVVHPADKELVEATLPEIAPILAEARHVRISADESMSPGGCVVRTAGGRIDARIETQIDRVAAALLGVEEKSVPMEEQ